MENNLLTNTLNAIDNSTIITDVINCLDIYYILVLIAFIIIVIFVFNFLDKTFKF